jgi:hypothetical protein
MTDKHQCFGGAYGLHLTALNCKPCVEKHGSTSSSRTLATIYHGVPLQSKVQSLIQEPQISQLGK